MYCPNCGMENPDEVRNCGNCGAVFGNAPATAAPITPKTSGLAIAALVLGIMSIFTCLLTGIPSIICGIISFIKIEKSGGRITGKSFAISGIVLPVVVLPILLMVILIPSLSKVREQSKQVVCLSNLRQLSIGWCIYADENDTKIVNGVAGQQGENGLSWTGRDWSSDYSSVQPLSEREQIQAIQDGALWQYCRSKEIYRCPAGLPKHLRTYSIVDSMNGIAREGTEEKQDVYIKTRTQIRRLASRIVFIDVGQIIPETYSVYYDRQQWWDQPPVCHNNGATLSYADGHAEYYIQSQ
jgi:prepilin-type processing-associated H-X9-DG protein